MSSYGYYTLLILVLVQLMNFSSSFQVPNAGCNKLDSRLLHSINFKSEDNYKDLSERLENDKLNRRSFLFTSSAIATTATLLSQPSLTKAEEPAPMATFALRRAGALPLSTRNLPPSKLGIFLNFGEAFLYSEDASRTPGKDVYASFEYPADWLQLDRIMGGVQLVDQRNGDKLYVLKVKLPNGVDKLEDVPKAYFGEAIFNPQGDLVRTGNNIEDFKVLSSKMATPDEDNQSVNLNLPRRRLKVRYTTVTGNNFSVDRKGIVDAYEAGGMIYMLMTGSNAVLFDKKGRERETVEYISDSFRVTLV